MTDASQAPTRTRAVMCLLLNIIVFPGLGTLVSGEPTRKKTGFLQLGLGILLIPMLVLVSMGSAIVAGADPETVRAWLTNFIMLLVIWNVITGIQIFRDAMKRAKRESAQR